MQLIQNSKLSSLGEMSAGIAHEVNNPLTIILAAVSQLNKFKEDSEKFEEKVSSIKKASYRIEKIISGLKKFSRLSDVKQYKKCSLNQIIKESLLLSNAKANENEVALKFDEQVGECYIECEEVEIEQVLINLISNAIDAIKRNKERWVKLELVSSSEFILLRVIDSGEGISPAIRQKIFDPFFTTKPVGEGTGLGLSIIKVILEEHRASIAINTECKNTCFEIKFKKEGH